MKLEKLGNALVAAILAFVVALAGIGCMETAFGFWVDMDMLWKILAVAAVAFGALSQFRRGGTVLLAALALSAGWLLQKGRLVIAVKTLAYEITRPWYSGYQWEFLNWGTAPTGQDVTFGLTVLALCIAFCVAWVIGRRKMLILAVIPALFPLYTCFVVTDTIPDARWLFWLLFTVALMLLTHGVRRRSAKEGLRLTALLLIPVFLASVLLFSALPEDEYEVQMSQLQQTILGWLRELPFVTQDPDGQLSLGTGGVLKRNMDLTDVGPKSLPRYAVMDVLSDRTELLYLRGQAMDVYTGTTWNVSGAGSLPDAGWPVKDLKEDGGISIHIRISNSVLYFPYYVSGKLWTDQFDQGSLPNPEGLRDYAFTRMTVKEGDTFFSDTNTSARDVYSQYLALPEDTRLWAKDFLIENGLATGNRAQNVQAICDFVRDSAEYDLETPRMPEGTEDFARWFLEESSTGYCVHYATAATVLLRAAGVHARFVTGYAQQIRAGRNTSITADKAHAWVEYFDAEAGYWKMIDPTPEIGIPEETTQPTETTAPPTTVPTEPTETTAPPTTAPTKPTEETTVPTTEATSPSTVPKETLPPENPVKTPRQPLWQGIWVIAGAFGAVGILLGQYALRRGRRKKKLSAGEPNRKAVYRWLYVARLCRYLKLQPPRELWELTEKAMFSQHTLTDGELAEFTRFIRQAHENLQSRKLLKRLWLKLILGLG